MSPVYNDFPERRRQSRTPLGLHLVYSKGSLDEPRPLRDMRQGFVLDLSYGGAQVALIDQFPAGTRLGLFIIGDLGAIQVEAEVAWSRHVPETEDVAAFEHGLRFLSRGPQLEQFVDLVTSQWKRFTPLP